MLLNLGDPGEVNDEGDVFNGALVHLVHESSLNPMKNSALFPLDELDN